MPQDQNQAEYLEELLRTFQFRLDSIAGTREVGGNDSSSSEGGGGTSSASSSAGSEQGAIKPEDRTDDLEPNKPSLPPKYSEFPAAVSARETPRAYEDPDWPREKDCRSQLAKPPQWNEYPTVFLSPENKGFE